MGTYDYNNNLGHMTKTVIMPIYGKTLEYSLLLNQKSDYLLAFNGASRKQGLQKDVKDDH